MSRGKRSRLWLRLGLCALLLGGSAFGWREYSRRQTTLDLPTAAARQGEFAVLIRCRGALSARHSVQITAPVDVPDLQIVWLAPSGGPVKEGESVIRFDTSKLKQDLQEKQVALKQAQATLDQAVAQARMKADQDKLDLATARYQMEKAKLEASKQAIVSVIVGQESAIDLRMAEEKVTLQESATELHQKSDDAKSASLKRLRDEAQAEVARAEKRLALADIKSPLDGVITYQSNTSQGWVNAQPFKVGDHASGGAVIAEIPDLSSLEMESKVDETDRGKIAVGDAVTVHVDAFPEKAMEATLVSISPLTEQTFEEWPPMAAFRAFAKMKALDSRLRPGMNAAADVIQSKLPNAISVPAKALFTHQGRPAGLSKDAERIHTDGRKGAGAQHRRSRG